MKKIFAVGTSLLLAGFAFAQSESARPVKSDTLREANGHVIRITPPRPDAVAPARVAEGSDELNLGDDTDDSNDGRLTEGIDDAGSTSHRVLPLARSSNISYHGGNIIPLAKVIPIFWGSAWGSGTANQDANNMIAFFEQYGTNGEFNVITQYYDTTTGSTRYIGLNTLTNSGDAWFDSTNPSSTKVTDAMVQAEVTKYLGSHTFNNSTIYEVMIPSGYYSDDGTGAQSCGGSNLQYCAYHSSYTHSGNDVKYAILPSPSCSGCQSSGFSSVQNLQHFACHETREAVSDPDGTAWWQSSNGYEADDKCAWSPAPFISGGFGYQYEWSNASKACVKTR